MNKSELIEELSERTGHNPKLTDKTVRIFFDRIKVALSAGDKVEIRPMMYLALSYDHRIIDGREAVSFLVKIKEVIEDPRRLVLGI